MPENPKVMISSTARDLPEHRKEVMDACLRQGMHPIMMEHLPASDADAIAASLAMVDEAEIYLGIFAHRYGYVPKGHDISITAMEYNRAVERGIPRLIFVMHEDHAVKASDVETGEGAEKLKKFKERLQTDQVVNFFKSPTDLRAHVINSLSKLRKSDIAQLHYISDIPQPPEAYIAHPYTLLQTGALVGRQPELNLLTDWVTKPGADIYRARILNIVAMGGMGKSALTWKWFNDIAPQEMKPLAGRLWWSFYESDASLENFVLRALAYVTGKPREDIQKITPPERETQLLALLDREPYLLVLDGLERILIAYARMDAAHLADDDLDEQTANFVTAVSGLPESAAQSFIGQYRLRKTADPRAGLFLRKLANVRAARILVSTRLYPADLQMNTGVLLAGSETLLLAGLSDDDALNLWRAYGMSGSRDDLLHAFHSFGNCPLLIRALAGEVAQYPRAPGNFDRWQEANPRLDLFKLDLKEVRTHVLQYALQGLDEKVRRVLHTIAAFRMPATYDALAALFVGEGKLFQSENTLDGVLTDLEDRGLLGWDKRANRYALHPIVQGVIWRALDEATRRGVYESLHSYFEMMPAINDWHQVNSLEDLTSAIELYNTLVGLGRYDAAEGLFHERLDGATLYRLSAARLRVELLEMLFPDGLDHLPRLSDMGHQGYALDVLAQGYHLSGQPGRAAPLYRLAGVIAEKEGNQKNLSVALRSLSNAQQSVGALRESEASARQALLITRGQNDRFGEGVSLYYIGMALAARGQAGESETALHRGLRIWLVLGNSQRKGRSNGDLAQRALWMGSPGTACLLADRAWELAHDQRLEGDFIRAARLQGTAALGLGNWSTADERLHHALTRSRTVNRAEEELPALVALAELRRQQGKADEARERLDEVWEAAERGPYPLDHADALIVLAQIERDAGHHEAAVKAATEAYTKAWCDGISADGKQCFAYWWGLQAARAHLKALGAPELVLPPFDESKYDPMPEVESNPNDEFHVGIIGLTAIISSTLRRWRAARRR